MKKLILIAAVVALGGCATRVVPGPDVRVEAISRANLEIVNSTPQGEPRMIFSDGITSAKSDYQKWGQVIVQRLADAIPGSIGTSKAKSIRVSLQSINCTGHYVPECAVSVFVERSDGVNKMYTTDALNGYPFDNSIQRAMNESVRLMASDPNLLKFVTE